MATLTLTDLTACLESLGLKIPLPTFSVARVMTRPLDIGRTYLAEILCSLVSCTPEKAYDSLQWPGDIYNGDLAVVLPKLCPGADSKALALELMTKVCPYQFSQITSRSFSNKLY